MLCKIHPPEWDVHVQQQEHFPLTRLGKSFSQGWSCWHSSLSHSHGDLVWNVHTPWWWVQSGWGVFPANLLWRWTMWSHTHYPNPCLLSPQPGTRHSSGAGAADMLICCTLYIPQGFQWFHFQEPGTCNNLYLKKKWYTF